ncbi:MAG: hypothetical protein ACWGOD_06405, partial [Desulfobulbales bacterium]
ASDFGSECRGFESSRARHIAGAINKKRSLRGIWRPHNVIPYRMMTILPDAPKKLKIVVIQNETTIDRK